MGFKNIEKIVNLDVKVIITVFSVIFHTWARVYQVTYAVYMKECPYYTPANTILPN